MILRKLLLAAFGAAALFASVPAAHADGYRYRDEWRERRWHEIQRERAWREHEWRLRHYRYGYERGW